MKKNYVICTVISAAVMILLPLAAVTTVSGQWGMFISILMLFIIDPAYSAFVGYIAGKNVRERFGLPLISAAMFFAGALLVIKMGTTDALTYTAVYLIIGVITMSVSALLQKRNAG